MKNVIFALFAFAFILSAAAIDPPDINSDQNPGVITMIHTSHAPVISAPASLRTFHVPVTTIGHTTAFSSGSAINYQARPYDYGPNRYVGNTVSNSQFVCDIPGAETRKPYYSKEHRERYSKENPIRHKMPENIERPELVPVYKYPKLE